MIIIDISRATSIPYCYMIFRRSALEKWKQKNGANATYGNLCAVFKRAGHEDLSDRVKEICPDIPGLYCLLV